MRTDPNRPPMDTPNPSLERRIVDEYLRDAGHDPHALRARSDAMAHSLLTDAQQYAQSRVTEVAAAPDQSRRLLGRDRD